MDNGTCNGCGATMRRCDCAETAMLQARVKELEAENKRLKELLETAHRYEIAHIYGSENAKDHRNGQKTGCVVCDMVSGREPTEQSNNK